MKQLGRIIGALVCGGEVFELIGDVGAGKTTLTKGIAEGLGVAEAVQSPTFTISRIYASPRNITIAHYDFYRLSEAGIMAEEIHEVMAQKDTVTIIEWAGAIHDVLPADRICIEIAATSETDRNITMTATSPSSKVLLAAIRKEFSI